MKGKIKSITTKIIIAIFSLFLIMECFGVNKVKAADDVLYISSSSTDVIAGKEFTVTLSISHASGISAAMLNLNYDTSMVTYVSGADGSGYAGVIPLNYLEATDSNKLEWVIKFKATKTGTCKFSVSDGEFYSSSEEEMNVTYNTASVKIWAQGSDDATLKSIEVGGHTLSPAFAKWTVNYTVYVGTNTTSVNIAAVSTQGGRVEVKGNPNNLAYGNNVVTITSYAPNGKAMKYTITIVRPEPVTEPPTEPTTQPPEWSEVVIDGVTYNINSEYSKDIIPAGFEPTVYDYKGNGVLASFGSKNGLNLLYLVDGEKNGKFFIYDGEEDAFYPFIMLTSLTNKYIVLPESMQEDPPKQCTSGTMEIGDYQIEGYVNNDNSEFGYFYAVNQDGTKGWYCYDTVEKTIQRLDTFKTENTPVETDPSEEDTQPSENTGDYSSENESLRAENEFLIKIRNIAIPVAAVLAVVLIGLIIFLLAHKSEKKHAIPMEDVDYAKLEDDEDISGYEAAILSQMAATEEVQEKTEKEPEEKPEGEPDAIAPTTDEVDEFRMEAETVIENVSLNEDVEDVPDSREDVEKEIISLDDDEDFL